MRMTMIVTGLAAALLLAGCGSGLVDIDNLGGAAAGNGAAPGAERGPQDPGGQGSPPRPGGRRNSREALIENCTADLGRNLPRGTDVPALCTCAVERMMQRVPQMDAVRQCAREQNVPLPGQ